MEGIGPDVYSSSPSSMGSATCFLDDEGLLLLALEAGFDVLEAGARWGGGHRSVIVGNTGWLGTNLALLSGGFLSRLFVLFIGDLVDFVTEVFARLFILSKSQSGIWNTSEVQQTFFAAFLFGAALVLGLASAFAFG